jgi:hypothetical protein
MIRATTFSVGPCGARHGGEAGFDRRG